MELQKALELVKKLDRIKKVQKKLDIFKKTEEFCMIELTGEDGNETGYRFSISHEDFEDEIIEIRKHIGEMLKNRLNKLLDEIKRI